MASLLQRLLLLMLGLVGLGSARLFRDDTPQLPHDPNTSPHCTWWLDYDGTETCEEILDWNMITMAQFVRWNPSLSPNCGGLTAGRSYCVEAYNEPNPPPVTTTTTPGPPTTTRTTTTTTSTSTRSPTTTTTTTTTTTPGNGIETPQPIQPGMVGNCDRFYLVQRDDSCAGIAIQHGVTQQLLIQWNPAVGSTCSSIWADTYMCVRVIGFQPPTVTTTGPTTTTTPGNGIQTPQPTQPGMVSNCDRFYFVKENDSCAGIASAHGISQQQFQTWNPTTGGTACSGLWANVHVCVRIIGFTPPTTTTSTRTTTTTPGNGISTPTPTQPGMVSNCDRFYFVRDGDSCASIGARHGIRANRISQWHTSVGATCSGLWANANVCVRTIGFQPQTQMSCGAGGGKLWGGNKPAALTAVGNWCNGDSSTDGSGGFATAQRKTGCYNAPMGNNKIQFQARNDFGAGASLSVAKCNEIMRLAVDRCDSGGTGTHEGWWFSAVVVEGRC